MSQALEPDSGKCWDFLGRVDFLQLKSRLVTALRTEIEALSQRQEPEPLYAFVVGVSPAHYGVCIYWNTPRNWAARAAQYAESGSPAHPGTKYNGPDFCCTSLTEGQDVWTTVWDALEGIEEICSEFYKLTGGGGVFYSIYENRFRSTAVHALREVLPDLARLPQTADFVCYVQDYVGAGDDLFLMLETVPEEKLRSVMPWLFTKAER